MRDFKLIVLFKKFNNMKFVENLHLRFLFFLLFISVCILQIGCSKTNTVPFSLPDHLYSIKSVLDIGNSGNAADIKLTVDPATTIVTTDIQNVRVIITKAIKGINENDGLGLASDRYFIFPVSTSKLQVIRPNAGLKDSDGDAIKAGDFKAYIFILGKENSTQLSDPKAFTLTERPPLAGDYKGTWEDLGPPGPGVFDISLRIKDDYSGSLFYSANYTPYGKGGSIDDAKIILKVTVDHFTFNMNQFIGQYLGGGAFGANGGCPNVKDLSGSIVDDISLVFDKFVWTDCDGSREVKMKFTRQ